MLHLIESIQTTIRTNPILAGGAGMAIMGGILMQARAIPGHIWNVIKDQFSATLTVYSEDSIFRFLNLWLARHPSASKSRRVNVAHMWNQVEEADDFELTPGSGYHLFREGMSFYLVHRVIETEKSAADFGQRRKQTIHITTPGRSRKSLERLIRQAKYIQEDHGTVAIHVWNGCEFNLVERRAKRSVASISLDPALKRSIVGDLRDFLASREKYARRCIPYRRGYLLEGPPGTGKSSVIFALASEFEMPIYIINIAALENDNHLLRAVNSAGAGFLVIEDIDGARAAANREGKAEQPSAAAASGAGVTLSGLLNATDGIAIKDGRVLFMTSNRPETLDPALIRPGRCDRRFHLGLADAAIAVEMFKRFFPGVDPTAFMAALDDVLPLAPSDIQNRLLEMDGANPA